MSNVFLKIEKEKIQIEVTTPYQILMGNFTKDKGIRLTDYFNREQTKTGFIVMSEVTILDMATREILGKKEFLAINVEYIVTATEMRASEKHNLEP